MKMMNMATCTENVKLVDNQEVSGNAWPLLFNDYLFQSEKAKPERSAYSISSVNRTGNFKKQHWIFSQTSREINFRVRSWQPPKHPCLSFLLHEQVLIDIPTSLFLLRAIPEF